jgi:hypothetical protein
MEHKPLAGWPLVLGVGGGDVAAWIYWFKLNDQLVIIKIFQLKI